MTTASLEELKIPSKQDLLIAKKTLDGFCHHTPIYQSSLTNTKTQCEVFFKCENLQKTGAFKFRGATLALLQLSQIERQKGVVTHSSGNHGQALAYSASILKIPAYVVVPDTISNVKRQAIIEYGAKVYTSQPEIEHRQATLLELVNKKGLTYIPPHDHPIIINGQATASMELLNEIEDLDYLLTPVGGGGLLSGTALSCYYFAPNCKVIGCEPQNVNDAYLSFTSGKLHPALAPNTIADGLRTCLGSLTFKIICKYVDRILTVSEDQIISAMQWVWERLKLIIEPSAAVPVAVLFSNKQFFEGKKVGIILSGGNVDLNKIGDLFSNESYK